jgi:hypothetical protein
LISHFPESLPGPDAAEFLEVDACSAPSTPLQARCKLMQSILISDLMLEIISGEKNDTKIEKYAAKP